MPPFQAKLPSKIWSGPLILLIVSLMVALAGCGKSHDAAPPQAGTPPVQAQRVSDPSPVQVINPLTGLPVDNLPVRMPLAVMLDNAPVARPHYGVTAADVVYEMLVEGGITRLMAVFYTGETELVGPIRSARPYFVDRALELNAAYVHVGQSPATIGYFKEHQVPHLDETYITNGFWRDKNRKQPHNLFSSTANLWEMAASRWPQGVEVKAGYSFSETTWPGEGAREIIIPYPLGSTKVSYTFHPESGTYLRFQGGKPHTDGASGEQFRAANIVVQFTPTKVIDKDGRLAVTTQGEGEALYFRDGVANNGRWVKEGLRSPTMFLDAAGQPVALKPGQTWFQVVPTGMKISFQ